MPLSNLPPGCSVRDIPGYNEPEISVEEETIYDWLESANCDQELIDRCTELVAGLVSDKFDATEKFDSIKTPFNRMRNALHQIAREFVDSDEMEESAEEVGLDKESYLEMAYDNIQQLALSAVYDIEPL